MCCNGLGSQIGWHLCTVAEGTWSNSDTFGYGVLSIANCGLKYQKSEPFKKWKSNGILPQNPVCFTCMGWIALRLFFSDARQEKVSVLRRRKLHILSLCPFSLPRDKGLGAAVLWCSVYLGEKQKTKALSLQANIDAGHWGKKKIWRNKWHFLHSHRWFSFHPSKNRLPEVTRAL